MRRVLEASWGDRVMLAEACICLALARVAVLALPFRVIARRLGGQMQETDLADDPVALGAGRRVGRAIAAVSKYAPWRTKCLEQAIAAKAMLRMRHVPNTMYLGVERGSDHDSPLGAHAWVRTGTLNVTGGANIERYAVLSKFADM